ncbi:Rap1-interacting factor 1 N terminal [Teratosphaeria destructans]|uniref:Rap1-interacting factor 1 N terminal n=1 Tax=Teratosphaeria destructans TaxID=418781 RepID=A0A9W7SXR8_9PEZI|nr:Rap1-interacting factor 1 N terminal [Teratosphaeria destructans]
MSRPSSRLHDLPERPPTPPRDTNKAVEDAIRFLDDSNEIERALKSSRPRSPAHSSSPTQPSPLVSQEARAGSNGPKKVGFTPIPTYHRIAGAGQQSSPSARPRKFCPSRRDARPLRSILKQTNAAPPPTPDDLEAKLSYFSPKEPGSFAKMLQSVVSQLGGPSISGRLDAYQALTGALRAYEGIPHVQSMISKMPILKQFITRDMNWKDHDGAPNFQIITNALSLTVAIFMEPKLADTLDDDFRAFVIERCILAIEHSGFSKQVIKIHMYLLAHQELYTSVMTSKRADRIIAALSSIETRCSGNSSVATRLVIYQRLLETFPSTMLNRVREWLEYVFHATLSKINEIRMRAVEVCTLASLTLGVNAAASKAILDLFENQVEDEQTYCDFYAKRLTDMIKDKEAATCVPRIWSAIILFFRNKRYPVESWTKLKPWLIIIQTCLNSSNTNVAEQAHLAWDKFVFAVMPDKSTSRNLFNLIKVPPLTSMGKGGSDKHSKQIKQSAVNSYYNLLHYGMRPGLSHEELDHAWDSYVEGGLKGMIKANGKGRLLACGVLHGLCKTGGGVWNPNAANEQTQIRPEDLPKLDSKWVRSRLGRILRLVEPIMKDLLSMPDEGAPLFDKTWQALMQTVADAGAQEVKTSNELKEALAMLVNLFRSLWMSCTTIPSGSDLTTCHTHYAGYVETAVQCIGAGPFAEDILTEGSDHSLQAALTPSHRSAKHRSSTLQSPLVFLFGLLHDSTSATTPIESVGPRLLRLLVSARPGRSLQLDLLCKSMQTWSMSYATGADASVTACLWSHVADATTTLLEKSDRADNRASDILGLEIRSACVIFAHGAKHVSHDKALQASAELYEAAFKLANSGAKHIGATLAVVEPAAKALLESSDSVSISSLAHLASIVGASAAWPRNKQEVEQGRKALWGVSLATSKNETCDPFDNLYQLISVTLNRTYRELETLTPDAASDALLATWRGLIQLLNGLLITDTALLNALEPILVAAFSSPHKAIVNETIDFWNKSFGAQSELSYPARLEAILRTRSKEAQISLPGLSSDDALALAHLPAFYESPWQQQVLTSSDSSNIFGGDLKRMPSSAPAVRGGHFGDTDTAAHTKLLSSPVAATRRTSKVSPAKARLRHDDSQVEFAPIESSPVSFDDSQMLTERQKETRTRQLASAHMFPELSSSPIVKPRNLTRGVQKRLDFHSDRTGADLEDDAATPTGPPEIGHPLSDDMPSSPTPSSTKDADAAEIEIDPPSSPPRQEEDPSEADKLTDDDVGGFEGLAAHGDGENTSKVADEPSTRLASVLPSDTLLPNEQLQMEADAAAQDQDVTDEDATEGTTCVKPIMSAEAGSAQQSNDNVSVVTIETSADDDVSRIENSFVQQAPAVTPDDPSPMHVSNHSEGLGKKRKRSPRGKESSSKKQKSQSPLKKFFASFLGRSQEAQDEDIGEEIVVASSQTSHSAASAKSQQNLSPRKPSAAAPASKKLAGKPAGQDIAPEQPKKRGPGRPRKSSTPATSQEQPAPGKSLKRKASTASVSSRGDLEATSIVKGTPAPAKARKQREGQDSRSTRVSQASQENSEDKRSSRQRIAEVVIPRGEQVATNIEADAEADEVDELAGSTMNDRRDVPAVAQRPIATPQSILTRLKGVLADLPRLILGSQDEREIDDMLFEIRKEVHEAGRRGKQ